MFGLFKAKPAAPPTPAPVPTPAHQPNYMLPGMVLTHMLGALVRNRRFQGGCDQLPGWQAETMPDGIQIARCREHLAGAVMAETAVALMFAGMDAGRTAMVSVGSVCKHYLQAEPDWQIGADGVWSASLPLTFAPGWRASFVLKDGDVDPLFTGKTLPGMQMTLTVAKG